MNAREAVKLIEADGWYLVSQKGSHMQFKHPVKAGKVTIPSHGGRDLRPAVMQSILKQARLK